MIETGADAELQAAEARYQRELALYRRVCKRLAAAKEAKATAAAALVAHQLASQRQRDAAEQARRRQMRADIRARWIAARGRITYKALAAEFGCTRHTARSIVDDVRLSIGTNVPTFWDWARGQGWSVAARNAYVHPGNCDAFHHLLLPIEMFREVMLAKMAALPREARQTALITWSE